MSRPAAGGKHKVSKPVQLTQQTLAGMIVYLDGSATGGDEGLHGGGVIASSKLLLLSLPAFHHRDGHQLLIHSGVQVQDLKHLTKPSGKQSKVMLSDD